MPPEIDDSDDDELVDSPVIKTAKKTRKKTNTAEQERRWLEKAKTGASGKFQIVIDPDLDNRGDHKSWTPYA